MKILRKFSITPTSTLEERHPYFVFGNEYPVLAIRQTSEGTFFLVADGAFEFHWVAMSECFLHSIEDKPGHGGAYQVRQVLIDD